MNRGTLIAFEGLDGCGKSTQLALIAEALEVADYDVLRTREPTDGPVGRRIREMARSNQRVSPEQELAWFSEDRREHVRDEIEPALAAGRVVLCDRYFLSSVAYQGARGLDPQQILRDSEKEFPLPELALIFEVPAELGLERVASRGGIAEPAFEDLAFLRGVERVFASLERTYIARVDARPAPEVIQQDVRERVRGVGVQRL